MTQIQNQFNLVDEPWIPIAGYGLASLSEVFTNHEFRALGGNPIQKIAITKLLLAICQTAATPKDDQEWAVLGADGMAKKANAYLQEKRDCFWLYGQRPFLQMPQIVALAKSKNSKAFKIGSGKIPDLPSANNTILTMSLCEQQLSDAERALFVVMLMNFSFAGKRVNKDIPALTEGLEKSVSAKPGPSLGNYVGYLHSYLLGSNILNTLWMNLLTQNALDEFGWINGLGIPPWEKMPEGENCDVANKLKNSYMSCLVALSRFVHLDRDGIHYVEGIQYPSHKEGWREPSISIDSSSAIPKLLWVDPEKRPWTQLTSLLSFITTTNGNNGYVCLQIKLGFNRALRANIPISIWSGGLKVRASSGDQSVKQNDDFVESEISLPNSADIGGAGNNWFPQLQLEMGFLEKLSSNIFSSTRLFFANLGSKDNSQATSASSLFWQLCEPHFQCLVDSCDDIHKITELRKAFASIVLRCYDTYCPKDTARQLDAWAKCRPKVGWYLRGDSANEKPAKPAKVAKVKKLATKKDEP